MRIRRGLSLLELVVVIAIVGILVGMLLPAVQAVRQAAQQAACQNQLRQIALAAHHYQTVHRSFPSGVSSDLSPQPFMAWGARLLPYLEQQAVWGEAVLAYKTDRDFRNVPPHAVMSTIVAAYLCPLEERRRADYSGGYNPALTSYLGVSGALPYAPWGGTMFLDSRIGPAEIRDGTSNTLFLGERPPSARRNLGWWYAGWGQNKTGSGDSVLSVRELNYGGSSSDCKAGPNPYGPGDLDNQCDAFHFWSLHKGGSNFAFCDGSVRFLAYTADAIMPALATRSGGESVNPDS